MITRRGTLRWLGALGAALVGRKALVAQAAEPSVAPDALGALPSTSYEPPEPGMVWNAERRFWHYAYTSQCARCDQPISSLFSEIFAGRCFPCAAPPSPWRNEPLTVTEKHVRAMLPHECQIPVSADCPNIAAVIAVYDQDRWYDWRRDGRYFVGRLRDTPLART